MPISLKVKYNSQLDNEYNPSGACNVTSIGMCLKYKGIEATLESQLEDELYVRLQDNGWSRHDPYDLQKIANLYPGIVDTFTEYGTFDDIYKAIDAGNPCVVHGYFTRFGHIIVIKGYTDNSFIVNDPYGEWHDWGYDTRASGESLEYSKGMIARLCSPESMGNPQDIFLHVISKK
jgi:uncharacterized protein YvpB